jgi:hypothetical protein
VVDAEVEQGGGGEENIFAEEVALIVRVAIACVLAVGVLGDCEGTL